MHIPRLLLAGTHSGVGKTSLAAALMAAFTELGLRVCPYKVGPDYIDPAFHTAITGLAARNLDSWLLPPETIQDIFYRSSLKSASLETLGEESFTLALIEGVMGLFDGQGTGHEGSTAQVAQILGAPVILIVDAKGMSRSAAALVRGYADFMQGLTISGVIMNRVSSPGHYALLKKALEENTGIPCFGYLPHKAAFALQNRHLGLIPAEEVQDLRERVQALAQAARQSIDLSGLLNLARSAPPLERPCPDLSCSLCDPDAPKPQPPTLQGHKTPAVSPVRIGIARDAAFSFYYQDNLDLLTFMGVHLVPFSPLTDPLLPEDLHGLYLGGGFPEAFAKILACNESMRHSVRSALEMGLPCYAECGGLLYLSRALTIQEGDSAAAEPVKKDYAMAGFLPCHAVMTPGLQRFGYAVATLLRDTILGPRGLAFRVHEFHYSRLIMEEDMEGTDPIYEVRKPDGRTWTDGLYKKRTLAVYPHLHFYSCPEVAGHFVAACKNRT
jgi:cobyrinic acid a,c-diamide synthase